MMWSPGECDTLDRQIIRFAAGPGEDDLVGRAADQAGDLPPRPFHRFVCCRAIRMATGWVAEMLLKEREHRIQNQGRDRRRRVVVQVDRPLHRAPSGVTAADESS